MLLETIALASQRIAETRRRNEKIALIAECLARLDPREVPIAACYLAGELPQGKIGIGYGQLSRMNVTPAAAASHTVLGTDAALTRIAGIGGRGSAGERQASLEALFAAATALEQSFLARLLAGELRQGALESLMVEGIARAAGVDAALARRAQMLASDLGAVARAARLGGEAGLRRFDLELLTPVQPMLAQSAEGIPEALSRLARPSFELKLDGARVQVHKAGGEVRVFTRRLNDVTHAVPEIVAEVRALPARELILDGETIALDASGAPLSFQTTMRRFGRKRDVDARRADIPLTTFYFDCLYAHGESLIDWPGEERVRALLETLGEARATPRVETASETEALAFFHRCLGQGHEGVMAKSLDAPYEAGRRGAGWLKLKEAHTLDLVVLAAEWGSGRRRGWLSNLHLGARDAEADGEFVMLGKTFKGMSDEILRWQTEKLAALATHREGHVVHVRPELVVEVAFNDVQASSQYPGGLALRFARVKRYRPDKAAREADTFRAVRELHRPSR